MPREENKSVTVRVCDSLTTRHIEQSSDTLQRTLTTHHIQQKLENLKPVQGQGNTDNASSGSGPTGNQQGSGDKK
jgi:hypothetical protein